MGQNVDSCAGETGCIEGKASRERIGVGLVVEKRSPPRAHIPAQSEAYQKNGM